ncbi:MAG: response regulator [Magnetococcus sp. MYC-9]
MTEHPGQRPTILIVDDSPSSVKILISILEQAFTLVAATSGQRALERATAAPPSMILLDIVMPKMDGFTVCERLQSMPSTCEIPIIFITVKADPEDETRGLALGAVDFISKPFSPSVVLARVKSHLALKQAQRQALQAAEAKGRFLAQMSHEIRTPLHGILGFADLLAQRDLEPKERQWVSAIQHSGRHLLAITNDILDYSKLEARKVRLESIAFDLERLLADSCALFAHSAQDKGLTLTWQRGDEVPDVLRGDPNRLRQVCDNLIANAIKFTHTGRVHVEVAVERWLAESILLRFSVQDSGIGIPPEAMARLFQPFEQADRSITRHFGGTGLGLTICDRLVRLMGGKIQAESVEGNGSCFHVTLPFTVASQPLSPPRFSPHTPEMAPFRQGAYRLLVVDDVETNRLFLKDALQMLGIDSVVLACDGLQALQRLQQQPFDLVLMDCQMPGMDGFATTRALRQWESTQATGRQTPVVALTAGLLSDDPEPCLVAGMDGFLGKPLTLHALWDLLNRFLPRDADGVSPTEAAPPTAREDETPALLDRQALDEKRRRLGKERHGHLLHTFLRDLTTNMAMLHGAVQAGDAAALMKTAHALKGCCGVVHAVGMSQLCQELEGMGETGAIQEAGALLARLEQESNRVRSLLADTGV